MIKPLVVSRNRKRLVVIDGRKRLMALRRLMFNGTLPKHLRRVPYIIIDQNRQGASDSTISKKRTRDTLTSDKLYGLIKHEQRCGKSISEIARQYNITKDTTRRLLTIDNLSSGLRRAFLGKQISLKQALAFATLPNTASQDALYAQLGALAKEDDILKAIARGETVLSLPDANTIILPSRETPNCHVA